MSVVFLLMGASALVALSFLVMFVRSVKSGQFDDTWSPARRMLTDDETPSARETKEGKMHE